MLQTCEKMRKTAAAILIIFVVSFLNAASAWAGNDDDIHDKIEYVNILGNLDAGRKDIYFNEIRKNFADSIGSRLISNDFNVDKFITDKKTKDLDLTCISEIIKLAEQKTKTDVVNSTISLDRFNEIMSKIKTLKTNRISQRLMCNECMKNEGCPLCKYILSKVDGNENDDFLAPAAIQRDFGTSQTAIKKDDYNETIAAFAACTNGIDTFIKSMPLNSQCNPVKCNKCAKIYLLFYRKLLFVKWYIELEKGYFLINKTNKYDEAVSYFQKLASDHVLPPEKTGDGGRGKLSLEKQIENCQKALKYIMTINCHYLLGFAYMQKKDYTKAFQEFDKSFKLSMNRPEYISDIIEVENDTNFKNKKSIFFTFPRSGLFSAFSDNSPSASYPFGKDFNILINCLYYAGCTAQAINDTKSALFYYENFISTYSFASDPTLGNFQSKLNADEFIEDVKKRKSEIESATTSAKICFDGEQYPGAEKVFVNIKEKEIYKGTVSIVNFPESLAEINITLTCETRPEDLEDNGKFFAENPKITNRRYLTDDGKKKNFGFYDGKTYKNIVELSLSRQKPRADYNFRTTSYCGDTFIIKATAKVNGIELSSNKKIQVWRRYELRIYTMKNNTPDLTPITKDAVEKFKKMFVLLTESKNIFVLHKMYIATDCTMEFEDELPLPIYKNELINSGVRFNKQNLYINIIGADRLRGRDPSDKKKWIFIDGFSSALLTNDEAFYSILLANGDLNPLNITKTIFHELGHCFCLSHENIECFMKQGIMT